jgi:hypothetical protein
MMMMRFAVATLLASALAVPAAAEEKVTVSGLLSEGYQVIHSEFGSAFLQFLLKKDSTIVWCTVQSQSGQTSSCRTIK